MDGKKKKASVASIDKLPTEHNKPESRFSKFGIGKLKRRTSLSKDKRKSGSDQYKIKSSDSNIPALSITVKLTENSNSEEDKELSEAVIPTIKPLSKSTSKSEDSLDSGIYSRYGKNEIKFKYTN